MNKRVKRKVSKRINNKIFNNERLTEFEIKYSGISKDLWTRVVNKKDELDKFPIGIDFSSSPDKTVYTNNIVPLEVDEVITETKNKVFRSIMKPEKDITKNDLWYKPISPKGVEVHIFDGNEFTRLCKYGEENSSSLVVMDQDNIKFTKKETKWQKVKGKVIGWFGK